MKGDSELPPSIPEATGAALSIYGASGFVGSHFKRLYPGVIEIQREDRTPESTSILYLISTVDNYNVHDNITLDVDTNLKILCEVLDHCRTGNIVFNFVSSWFVFGKMPNLPAQEDALCKPSGFYSITKKCAEDLIVSFAQTYGMKYRILRLCNVLGSGDKKASRKKNAITWLVDQIKLGHDVDLYDSGSHIRDVMHVDDVCRAIQLVCERGELNEVYNIGSGIPTSISEIVLTAKNYLKSNSQINSVDSPAFHNAVQTRDFWMNTKKLKALGFEQKRSIEFIVEDLCH